MTKTQPAPLQTLSHDDLVTATGGLDVGSLVGNIAGIADQFTNGKASPVAKNVMGIINAFKSDQGGQGGQGGQTGA